MLGNIYELITEEGDSIDEFVSSGNVKKLVHEKFEEKINLPMMETVSICVELLVIHVLQRL